jgi:hypothetical protein
MTGRLARGLLLAAQLLSAPDAAHTQQNAAPPPVPSRVVPDTVAVGEPFHTVVFPSLPDGAAMELRVPADLRERVEIVGAPRVLAPDTLVASHRAVARLVVWTPGPRDTYPAELRVTLGDGTLQTWPVALALPHVRSVLPDDTAGVRPRPPADVLPVDEARFPGWWAALAALAATTALLAVVAGLALWRRRRMRRRGAGVHAVPADARSRALAALDGARKAGLLEAGRPDRFYDAMSGTLRTFVAETHPDWGEDLTTPELLDRMGRGGVRADDVAALAEVLRAADLAKFARRTPPPGVALDDWRRARAWVEAFGGGAAATGASAGSAG